MDYISILVIFQVSFLKCCEITLCGSVWRVSLRIRSRGPRPAKRSLRIWKIWRKIWDSQKNRCQRPKVWELPEVCPDCKMNLFLPSSSKLSQLLKGPEKENSSVDNQIIESSSHLLIQTSRSTAWNWCVPHSRSCIVFAQLVTSRLSGRLWDLVTFVPWRRGNRPFMWQLHVEMWKLLSSCYSRVPVFLLEIKMVECHCTWQLFMAT